MIYFIAFLFGLVSAILSLINEYKINNIYLLENGRDPTAGIALLFPLLVYQILALGIACIIQLFTPAHSIIILVILFSLYAILQIIFVLQSSSKFKYLKNRHETLKLSSLIVPQHLQRGDKVAAVSLSWGGGGDAMFRHRYEAGKKALQDHFGVTVVEMPHTLKGTDFVYNNPRARADDLHAAFADPSIKAVISVIGGDDSVRMLPFINYDILRANPKIFMGYSDATVTNFICLKAGLRAFNGPALMCKLGENGGMHGYTKNAVQRTLFDTQPIGTIIPAPEGWTCDRIPWDAPELQNQKRVMEPQTGWRFIQGTSAVSGRLIGGCTEVLMFFVGTEIWPAMQTWDGAILFIENSEDAISDAQFLYNLRNLGAQGILQRLAGIIFAKPANIPVINWPKYDTALLKVTAEFGRSDMPIITQMDFGHTDPVFVLPIGAMATIDPVAQIFSIDESGCI